MNKYKTKLISYVLTLFVGVTFISFCLISALTWFLYSISLVINYVASKVSFTDISLTILLLSVFFTVYAMKKGLRNVIDRRFHD